MKRITSIGLVVTDMTEPKRNEEMLLSFTDRHACAAAFCEGKSSPMSTTAPEMNDLARPPRVHPGWLVLGLALATLLIPKEIILISKDLLIY